MHLTTNLMHIREKMYGKRIYSDIPYFRDIEPGTTFYFFGGSDILIALPIAVQYKNE